MTYHNNHQVSTFSQVDSCVQTKPKKAQTSQCRYLSKFTLIHELSMLRDFCGGKRAEGDQRVGGCPVPALGPSCLNDGYSKTIDEKHIVYEGNWWRIVIFRYIRIIIQEKNMLRGIHALTTYASQIRDSTLDEVREFL